MLKIRFTPWKRWKQEGKLNGKGYHKINFLMLVLRLSKYNNQNLDS